MSDELTLTWYNFCWLFLGIFVGFVCMTCVVALGIWGYQKAKDYAKRDR